MARFFIDRPIFAWVIAIIIMLAGALAIHAAADRAVPEHRAADGHHQRDLSGRLGADGRGLGHPGHRAEHDRPRRPDVHVVDEQRRSGIATITLTFEAGTDPDIAQVQVQNKLQLAMPLLPQEVQRQGVTVNKSTSSFLHGRRLHLAEDGTLSTRRHRRLHRSRTCSIRSAA